MPSAGDTYSHLPNRDQTTSLFLYLQLRLRRKHAPVRSKKEKTYEDAGCTPVDRTQETAIVASDVEEGERQAADPFLVDWDDNDPDHLPCRRTSQLGI